MQPLDGDRLWIVNAAARRRAWGFGGKNLNFEKRLTWTIGRSDGKLVLARCRRVDFWFWVADRGNQLAFVVLGSAAARWRAWPFIDLGGEFEFSEVTDVVREASTCFWVHPLDEARART